MTEQASYSGNCWEQEPSSSSANEECANSFTASDLAGFDVNIGRQVELTDSNEQRFDSHFAQNFEPKGRLGKGGFGVVFESRNKVDQCSYAIKRIKLPNRPEERKKAMREVRALARLKNENIVGYFSAWIEAPPQGWQKKTDKELMPDISSSQSSGSNSISSSTDIEKINQSGRNEASDFCVFFENTNEKSRSAKPRKENIEHTYLYIQMELCQKESLQIWLENNHSRDYKYCYFIFDEVSCGVEYLHANNLIHRDLKPSNILLSLDDVIKLGDFGLVTETDNEMIEDISENSEINTVEYITKKGTHTKGVGTRLYMAPEQMSGGNYGKGVDIFALGLILFELFSSFSTQMERICEMEVARDSKFDENFTNQIEAGLAKRMLSSRPSHRPTAQQMQLEITCLHWMRFAHSTIFRKIFFDGPFETYQMCWPEIMPKTWQEKRQKELREELREDMWAKLWEEKPKGRQNEWDDELWMIMWEKQPLEWEEKLLKEGLDDRHEKQLEKWLKKCYESRHEKWYKISRITKEIEEADWMQWQEWQERREISRHLIVQ